MANTTMTTITKDKLKEMLSENVFNIDFDDFIFNYSIDHFGFSQSDSTDFYLIFVCRTIYSMLKDIDYNKDYR